MSKNQSSHSHDHSHDHGGHDHSHDHGGHDHSHGGGLGGHTHDLRGASKRHLKYALFLITGYMFVEVVGGIISGSLALIADAGHMLTDAASIGLALVAMYYAERTATAKHTYGFQRFEILAALANALTLWLIVAVILYQAYQRLSSPPPEIEGGLMLAVGFVGLLVNVGAAVILHKSIGHSVNVEGAYQHVIADLLGSVGVVISGILIWAFGWQLADLVVTVILSILILWGTWGLLKRVVHVLLEGVPKHVDVHEMCRAIEELPGVALIHDIHVWTLSPGSDALTAHILIDPDYGGKRDEMLRSLRKIIGDDYGIAHLTIQLETQLTGCTEDHHVDNLLALAKM